MYNNLNPRAIIKMMDMLEDELKKRMTPEEYYALSDRIAIEGVKVDLEDIKKNAPFRREPFRNILIGDLLDHAEMLFWDILEIYIDGMDWAPQYEFTGHDTIPEEIQNLAVETWLVDYNDIDGHYTLSIII